MKNELKKYLDLYLKEDRNLFRSLKSVLFDTKESTSIFEEGECCPSASYSMDNIDTFINENKKEFNDFQTLLFRFIDNKELKDSDVYNKVHLDRRTFSKIRSDSNYHPSKETVILLGLSLELSEEEFDELLLSASYSLPKNNHYDLIIRFCFIHKIYNVMDVNELLNDYDCKALSY